MRTRGAAASFLLCLAQGVRVSAAEAPPPGPTIETGAAAAADDGEEPRRSWIRWNEFDGPISTFRFGAGILLDGSAYSQDQASRDQITMEPDAGVRDFRVLFKGTFKTERPMSWSIGYMYDGAAKDWRFRQTGLQIGIPEWNGSLFIGRTKEGYSMVKVIVGYYGWTMERQPVLDAFIPILADGLKWSGYLPRPRVFYQLGFYADALSEDETFATSDHQFVTRFGWQPILSESDRRVLHVALMERTAEPDNDTVRERSRPEAFLAPYFVDTGPFEATRTDTAGIEAYYRTGPWMFGSEYDWRRVDARDGTTPQFHGGDVVATWLVTGETRPYNAFSATFQGISPSRPVFEGGPGAWEAVLHVSYADFDSGSLQGGKLWRVTPMANWYLNDNMRLEFAYGYSGLDRFGFLGHTQFFQARIQMIF
jgi:phosphate-selective porin OprO/OprP